MTLPKIYMLLPAVLIAASLAPARSAPSGVPYSVYDLLCTGKVTSVNVDIPEYINIRSMEVDGSRLKLTIEYGVEPSYHNLKVSQTNGIAYELDGKPVVTLRPLLNATQAAIALSFVRLAPGEHRINIGHALASGEFDFSNAFCFSSPSHFKVYGNNRL